MTQLSALVHRNTYRILILQRNWTYNKTTTMINRLELQVKKSGSNNKVSELKAANPKAAPGRLAGLRNNAVRFVQYTTEKGEKLSIPVTVERNIPNPSKGIKRKHDDAISQPTIRWSKVSRKPRGDNY